MIRFLKFIITIIHIKYEDKKYKNNDDLYLLTKIYLFINTNKYFLIIGNTNKYFK